MTAAPYKLGLTGSIGMGKSTTASIFAGAGVPVWDADAAVARLYAAGGAGVRAIAGLAPDVVTDGAVDRNRLRTAIRRDPGLLDRIERVVHPMVGADRAAFLAEWRAAPLVVLDIPLLYETGAEAALDGVLVVTAPPEVQRARVLGRPTMDAATFETILARQTPDAQKRARADFVIRTDNGVEAARADVLDLIARLSGDRNA